MSDTPSLVRATAGDVDAIHNLTREAYARWVPIIGREPLPMVADHAEAVRAHRVDLLHLEGRLVGVIELIAEVDHLLIENVAVLPGFQGRGLGRRLLAHAEEVAASLGHALIRLYTNKQFTDNLRFYQKQGYRIDREEPFRGGHTVYMSKSLET